MQIICQVCGNMINDVNCKRCPRCYCIVKKLPKCGDCKRCSLNFKNCGEQK